MFDTAKDGTTYTFFCAKYHDDHFFIKTLIDKKGVIHSVGRFTIQQLRELIGELPKPKNWFQLQLQKICVHT
jgi:hypothetical protein